MNSALSLKVFAHGLGIACSLPAAPGATIFEGLGWGGGGAGRASCVVLVAEASWAALWARFVADSGSFAAAVLPKLLTSCLAAVGGHWIGCCGAVCRGDGIGYFGQLKILVMFSIGLGLRAFELLDCLRVAFLRCVLRCFVFLWGIGLLI